MASTLRLPKEHFKADLHGISTLGIWPFFDGGLFSLQAHVLCVFLMSFAFLSVAFLNSVIK